MWPENGRRGGREGPRTRAGEAAVDHRRRRGEDVHPAGGEGGRASRGNGDLPAPGEESRCPDRYARDPAAGFLLPAGGGPAAGGALPGPLSDPGYPAGRGGRVAGRGGGSRGGGTEAAAP